MNRLPTAVFAAIALGVVATALFVWYDRRAEGLPVGQTGGAPVLALPVPAASAEGATTAAVEHPIERVAEEAASQGPIPPEAVEGALERLFGRKAVLSMLQLDDFPRRVAASVDALGRSHSSSRLWPVVPAPERFMVRSEGGMTTIDPDNGQRYTPFVLLIESIDLRQAAALYRRMYPLLQDAYTALGYPGRHFNDRVVAVIDQLIATPDPAGPLQVQLPTFGGAVQPKRPWLLYRFVEPRLEALSSGQKILLRAGPVNERRFKARLSELRSLLATPGTPMR
ncbi:MAG: DUF3014 domain-containing protein [Caldimonas sp.]